MEQDYNDYIKSVCIEALINYGYDAQDFSFYDLAEHDLYIYTVDGDVIMVEEFY